MLPDAFKKQLELSLGPERAGEVISIISSTPASVAIRINPFKIKEFPAQFSSGTGTFSRWGRLLPERPSFVHDPLFHAGAYYVQEASSMYLESIFPLMQEMRAESAAGSFAVLDLCAAPGGKSTHLLSMLKDIPDALLVSNEISRTRASVLCGNISKWGAANVMVTSNDPAGFRCLEGFFDVIVVDAPCSGEGMFRKDPEAVAQWSEDNVRLCAARQRRILADILPCLRPSGLLVYSTCTFNHCEDEDNVAWLSANFGFKVLDCKHFYPGDPKAGEGFFFSAMRREGNPEGSLHVKKSRSARQGQYQIWKDKLPWVRDGFEVYRRGGQLKAFPAGVAESMLAVEEMQSLKILMSGTAVAEIMDGKGGSKSGDRPVVLPQYSLIQSEVYRRGSLPEVEVSMETAMDYMQRKAILLQGAPTGYVVLTYGGIPFGLVKNIGQRCNSLLPPSLRVRTEMPSEKD